MSLKIQWFLSECPNEVPDEKRLYANTSARTSVDPWAFPHEVSLRVQGLPSFFVLQVKLSDAQPHLFLLLASFAPLYPV